jgi:hypothetical protein
MSDVPFLINGNNIALNLGYSLGVALNGQNV